ncbi:MAG: histidinol dehydrogenase [Candidatus Electrothrix sp. Rat3]|nr:histidinol dehydrogenase [Candidatus Electrothrix rattekaaiensis]
MTIRIESYATDQGKKSMDSLRDRFTLADSKCAQTVTDILEQVRSRGDEAVLEYTRRFDAPELSLKAFKVSEEEFVQAAEAVDDDFMDTLAFAAERIRLFHEREMEDSWMMTRDDGTITGRLVRPVDSAGLYVPGGQGGSTPLVSSVLMNAIPAGIAGVEQRIMMTPPNKEGKIAPALLMAAQEVGVTEVYKAGSAWAIAALAFGTESVPAVDVIVGPGNQFVTEAKRQVMGRVRIDMIAGPSEVLIVADQAANPAYIAADMLAQAEHDPMALALLLTTETSVAEAVKVELEKQLPNLTREDIARTSLQQRGLILVVDSVEEGIQLANEIAIEHLELQVEDPWQWLPMIKHAGAIFLGPHTPEAAGDYVAGPNHVLPTMGTARISSALGVETFLKKSSIISYSRQALLNDAKHIQRLAQLEGLSAHANSVAVRVKG